MRERKPETIIAELRRHEKALRAELAEAIQASGTYRHRATKAEQDAAEWKRRFDELLLRLPLAGGPEKGGGE